MISIFVNPLAGKGTAIRIAAVLEKILSGKKKSFCIYKDNWPVDLINCSEAWIVGGDGTLNYFINKYKNIQIPLVIFKGGTGNDFAWKLYQDISLNEQAELVLNASSRAIDGASCNNKIFVNAVGIGFDGEVLKSMGTIRRMGGHVGYLWVVLKKILRFKEFNFKIRSDAQNFNDRFLLVNITNKNDYGCIIESQSI